MTDKELDELEARLRERWSPEFPIPNSMLEEAADALSELRVKNGDIKRERDKFKGLLVRALSLKVMKETQGKTYTYNKEQPELWREIAVALGYENALSKALEDKENTQ